MSEPNQPSRAADNPGEPDPDEQPTARETAESQRQDAGQESAEAQHSSPARPGAPAPSPDPARNAAAAGPQGQYPGHGYPSQSSEGQSYSGQPYAGQPYAGQPYAGQPYAGQPYAGQPYAGQPYAGQPYPGQPYPGQPYPGQPYLGQPYPPDPGQQGQPSYPGPGNGQYPPIDSQPPIVWHPHAVRPPELPVVPRQYHEFYRTPRLRWWHPLVALAAFVAAWFVATLVVSAAALFYDFAVGNYDFDDLLVQIPIPPALFLANNVGLALAIPLAVGVQRLVFRQRSGWLYSIVGRFRWGLLGRFMLITLAFYLVLLGFELVVGGLPTGLRVHPETWFLLASVILTTPLQSAGEEVAMRGLMARSIGAWFPGSRVGLVVSTVVTTAVFAVLHGAGDPWLNLQYVCFGVIASVLAWKTGGLEAPIALHVVNNLLGLLLVPFTGLDGLFDREAGVGSPAVLVQIVVMVAAAGAMLWQARRLGLPTSTAPAAPAGTVDAQEPSGSRPGWG